MLLPIFTHRKCISLFDLKKNQKAKEIKICLYKNMYILIYSLTYLKPIKIGEK